MSRDNSDWLEVVAWQDAENPLYTTGEKRQMHAWVTDGYPIVELVRKSDAMAEVEKLKQDCMTYLHEVEQLKAQIAAHDVASVPELWKIERSFDVLPCPCVDGKSHQPTIKIVLPACAPNDMAAFDVRDQIAETVRKLLAAPSSPAAPKGGE